MEFKRDHLYDGTLYCPEVDMIVDESKKIKINKQINDLTEIKTDFGTKFRHLRDMTKEERNLYRELEDKRYNFYKNEMKFIMYGDEEKYLEDISKIYKDT